MKIKKVIALAFSRFVQDKYLITLALITAVLTFSLSKIQDFLRGNALILSCLFFILYLAAFAFLIMTHIGFIQHVVHGLRIARFSIGKRIRYSLLYFWRGFGTTLVATGAILPFVCVLLVTQPSSLEPSPYLGTISIPSWPIYILIATVTEMALVNIVSNNNGLLPSLSYAIGLVTKNILPLLPLGATVYFAFQLHTRLVNAFPPAFNTLAWIFAVTTYTFVWGYLQTLWILVYLAIGEVTKKKAVRRKTRKA